MRALKLIPFAAALAIATAASAEAPQLTPEQKAYQAQLNALPWENAGAPAITDRASIRLGPQIRALDETGTGQLLKLTGNLPESGSYTVAAKSGNWFAIYSFQDIGYVRDDEKIDADALLKTLQENQQEANSTRSSQGLEPLTVTGWAVPPHYDSTTHNLEYGVILSAPSGDNINYHLRMLGRRGVMDAALITTAQYLQEDLAEFRNANKGFAFRTDESYAAFKDGDKVSEYGLAALITGGAAAAAVKGGLLKGLIAALAAGWKLIAVGIAGAWAAFRKFFSKGEDLGPPPSGA